MLSLIWDPVSSWSVKLNILKFLPREAGNMFKYDVYEMSLTLVDGEINEKHALLSSSGLSYGYFSDLIWG